jgi:glutamate carboxypeptidase
MALSPRERALRERLDRSGDAMLARLAEAVAVPSGGGHRQGLDRLRAAAASRLSALGAELEEAPVQARPAWVDPSGTVDAMAPTLVARRTRGRDGARLLLSGHLDTVHDPRGDFQRLEPRGDGAMIGPGCADMKGGVEVMLSALEALEAEGVAVAWTVVLVGDEESGSFGSAATIARVAAEHDRAFVVEPAAGAGDLVVARPGSGQFMIEAFGRAAHAGRDFTKGVSAVQALARAVLGAGALADAAAGRLVNVGPLEGGAATNIVPDRARAWGNLRYRDEADGRALGAALDALAMGGEGDVPSVRLTRLHNRPAKPCTESVRALGERAQAVAADLGLQVGLASTGGVSDANLIQHAGPPTLDGLGVRGGNLHRTDEFMWPESLAERAALLAVLLARESAVR